MIIAKISYIFMSIYLTIFIIDYTYKRKKYDKEYPLEQIDYEEYTEEQQKLIIKFIKKWNLIFKVVLLFVVLGAFTSYGIAIYAILESKASILFCLPLIITATSGLICGIILCNFKFKGKEKI